MIKPCWRNLSVLLSYHFSLADGVS